jgi:hypothetical protein
MKTWIALLTVAGLCPLLAHAAVGEGLATPHESRLTLYFSMPLAMSGRPSGHHADAPVVGLRLDRPVFTLGGNSSVELAGRPVVSLMDLRLSMGRERGVLFDGIPMWTANEQSRASSESGEGATPAKPFWKKPTFWIVTGAVATVWILSDLSRGYVKSVSGGGG